MKKLALVLAAATLLSPVGLRAQGFLTSFACGTPPSELRIDVQVLDDRDQVLRLREAVVEALQKRGAKVYGDAPLRLLVDPEAPGTDRPGGNRDLTRLDDNRDNTLGGQTELGSQLEELRERRTRSEARTPVGDIVRIAMILNAKATGRCLWQGEIRYDAGGADYWEIAVKLAPHLANAIGKAENNRRITLR